MAYKNGVAVGNNITGKPVKFADAVQEQNDNLEGGIVR